MLVRVRHRGTPREVGVRSEHCPTLTCFHVVEHQPRSAAGYSGCSSSASGRHECGTRDGRGCPGGPEQDELLDPPRFTRGRRGRDGRTTWEEVPR